MALEPVPRPLPPTSSPPRGPGGSSGTGPTPPRWGPWRTGRSQGPAGPAAASLPAGCPAPSAPCTGSGRREGDWENTARWLGGLEYVPVSGGSRIVCKSIEAAQCTEPGAQRRWGYTPKGGASGLRRFSRARSERRVSGRRASAPGFHLPPAYQSPQALG